MLLCRFFHFFVVEFQWGTEVVSVRLGQRVHRTEPEFAALPGRWASRLHVEDPFFLNRNLNRVLGVDQEKRLQAKLIAALEGLRAGAGLRGLIGGRSSVAGAPKGGVDAKGGSARSRSRGSQAGDGSSSESEGILLECGKPVAVAPAAGEARREGDGRGAPARWLGPEHPAAPDECLGEPMRLQ